MKKQLSILLTLLLGSSILTFGQDAKGILDKLSEKASTYKSIKAVFEYKMLNTMDQIDETQKGSIFTQGEKYHINIASQEIISDGKTVWTVIPEAEEVQINNVPEEDESDFISPTNILKLWEKGFKYKYDKEATLNGKQVHIINLYPEQPEDKSYHTIKLFINKNEMEPAQIVIKGKDGTDFTYVIKSFETNLVVPKGTFTFNNPAYEVIDLR